MRKVQSEVDLDKKQLDQIIKMVVLTMMVVMIVLHWMVMMKKSCSGERAGGGKQVEGGGNGQCQGDFGGDGGFGIHYNDMILLMVW